MKGLALSVALVLTSACGGSSGGGTPTTPAPTVPTIPSGVSALVASMFQQLPAYIQSTLAENQANLPRNPQGAASINAKIALLQRPALAADISAGRLFVESSVTSTDGRQISMAAMFPEERSRTEAVAALDVMARSLPHLERFMDTPFPATTLRLWYGFTVGNSGGNAAASALRAADPVRSDRRLRRRGASTVERPGQGEARSRRGVTMYAV